MAGVRDADALACPIVEGPEAVIGIALAKHDLHLVIRVERRIIGEDVESTAFPAVLPQLLGLDDHLAETQTCRIRDDPVLQPVFIAANSL
jgi:hypothetical protein